MEPQRNQSGRADFQAPLRRTDYTGTTNGGAPSITDAQPVASSADPTPISQPPQQPVSWSSDPVSSAEPVISAQPQPQPEVFSTSRVASTELETIASPMAPIDLPVPESTPAQQPVSTSPQPIIPTAPVAQLTSTTNPDELLELASLDQPVAQLTPRPLTAPTQQPKEEPERLSRKRLIISGTLSALVVLAVVCGGIALYRGQHHAPDTTIGRPGAVSPSTDSSNASTVAGSAQDKSNNALRQANIESIQTNVEAYYTQHSLYPTTAEMTNASWVKANLQNLDANALKDPQGTTASLVSAPTKNALSYQAGADPSLTACDNVQVNCNYYKLTAILSDGSQLVKDAKQ